jgi:ParB family transcriptional regulator, chromosome partitioning protein
VQQENEMYRRRLGRGISALLGGAAPAPQETTPASNLDLRHIGVEQIERNPFQPRKEFDADALTELAASIKEHGVLQPLLVREVDGGFQLVAGERRWQAAKKAGLTAVPCRVLDVVDKTACEVALEENLKRKDLTDIEKAHAFRRYIDHFQCTIEELARQLSMSRSNVNNILRLLDLPEPIRIALQAGKITSGHARAILSLSDVADQLAMCGRVQAEGLSVRQTEAAARQINNPQPAVEPSAATDVETVTPTNEQAGPETIPMPQPTASEERTNHVHSLEEQLGALLGVKVEIRLKSKDTGVIVVPFASNDEFERILTRLRRAAA